MTPIESLVEEAQALGADFKVEGERVTVGGPAPLPRNLLDQLKEHREELISYLSGKVVSSDHHSRLTLLAWASQLAEQDLVLAEPVSFTEALLRTITTREVSRQAAIYLRDISRARTNQATGGWHPFTADWWLDQEQQAIQALIALKDAVEEVQQEVNHDQRR